MKQCSKCGQEKDELHFSKATKKCGGLMHWCKLCVAKYDKNRYNKEKFNICSKNNRNKKIAKKRSKEYVLNFLINHSCTDCGENNPIVLEFDHLRDKKFNISDGHYRGLGLNTVIAEIAKCEVVCANCHRIRTHNRREAKKCLKSVT